ncbi:hypothetical protein [Pseudomonas sp. R4-34-07]|uniref:hypothetical protein n=1 Tax=Pseudomonas sp. R4-34-07 TaxID=658642 RepID=UPI000F571E68|nr:hypothetical protein [Pseudomonas sp. R4-34-07]
MTIENIDWSQLTTAHARADVLLQPLIEAQAIWRAAEMAFIADQLIALEDVDPDALPGTDRQWRDYRTQVRRWTLGAEGYPAIELRPRRPT